MKSTPEPSFDVIVTKSFSEFERRVFSKDISWIKDQVEQAGHTLATLIRIIKEHAEFRRSIRKDYVRMEKAVADAADPGSHKRILLEFLGTFGSPETLKEDARAFSRWMDIGAVRERARIELHSRERRVQQVIRLLPAMIMDVERQVRSASVVSIWLTEDLDRILEAEFNETPRWQNQQAILDVVAICAASLPVAETGSFIHRIWIDRAQEIVRIPSFTAWIQLAAFRILDLVEPRKSIEIILDRVRRASRVPDDMFGRAGMIRHLLARMSRDDSMSLIQTLFSIPDPSEHVLMTAYERIGSMEPERARPMLKGILVSDRVSAKFRAAVMRSYYRSVESCEKAKDSKRIARDTLDLLIESLPFLKDVLPARALLDLLRQSGRILAEQRESDAISPADMTLLRICDSIIMDPSFKDIIRRQASCVREEFLLNVTASTRNLLELLHANMRTMNEGETLSIESADVPDETSLGRVLSLMSQRGFSFSAVKQNGIYLITKGDLYQRRIWRLLFEILHPSPAKRQGFLHSVGRSPQGTIRAPSHILAEMTETKVPGERLFLNSEASWRPYIPSVDDILSLSSSGLAGKEIQIFSSDGVTSLRAPDSMTSRIKLWLRITLEYRKLSYLRNMDAAQLELNMKPSFLRTIESQYGIKVSFNPHVYFFEGKGFSAMDPVVLTHMGSAHAESGLRGRQ